MPEKHTIFAGCKRDVYVSNFSGFPNPRRPISDLKITALGVGRKKEV